jgi:TRAP-type C4-dicarboxylate transport system permease small subunit
MNDVPAIERNRNGAQAVGRFFARLTQLECLVAVFALCLSAGALVADIVSRELFSHGLFGSLRVAVYATAIAALSGFAICVATGSHLRVTVVDNLVPERWRPAVARAGNFLSFAICAYFAYWAIFYIRQTATIGETDPSLGIQVWPIQCILAWMFISGGARYLAYGVFPELEPEEAEPTS